MKSRASPRRQAREAALQVLYAADLGRSLAAGEIERAYHDVSLAFDLPPRAEARAHTLVTGVAANLKTIDERIESASRHWSVARLASVDRNVLRIGVYELLFEPETPAEVVIDEAVEIARRFAGEASPAFVNGVLDSVAKRR